MRKFVELNRRFSRLPDSELRDVDSQVALDEHNLPPSLGWPDLLNCHRIVVLAEAGSGKTREVQAQSQRLVREGCDSFFIELDSLAGGIETSIGSVGDRNRFEAWKKLGNGPAWFFLDAVDELKLTGRKFELALRHLSHALNGHLNRAKVVVTCRPSDWRPSRDLDTLQALLPVRENEHMGRRAGSDAEGSEFVEAAFEAESLDKGEGNEQSVIGGVQTAVLHPLNNQQIRTFVMQSGVVDAGAFLNEVATQDAWIFARRPLDLIQLIDVWRNSGRLGTRQHQHETNVKSKLVEEDQDRADNKVLSEDRARLGVERLALALALTKTRTLRSPEQSLHGDRQDAILEPSSILSDWTPAERRALLRKGLFGPATYGRVRFHHRSVQEYLAACGLRALLDKGMSVNALFRLLFTDKYHLPVVFPSMRPIAAWLALWDGNVRKEIIRREPETLLSMGDPESLDVSARRDLIRKLAVRYGKGGLRGLRIPDDQVQRLAHPELSAVVRECWGAKPTNEEVRELLIELIRFGPMKDCAEPMVGVATDPEEPAHLRISAIRALLNCERKGVVREMADDMLTGTSQWPASVIHGVSPDLFPAIIDVKDLILLVKQTPEPPEFQVGGFEWSLQKIVNNIESRSETAVSLRDGLVELMWRGRRESEIPYDMSGWFDYLAPALAKLCDLQLVESSGHCPAELVRASVIASRFGNAAMDVDNPVSALRERFSADPKLRKEGFWADLELMDAFRPVDGEWHRFRRISHDGLIDSLSEIDRDWLGEALADKSKPDRRGVALHALFWLWDLGSRDESELASIRAKIDGDVGLTEIFDELTAPPTAELKAQAEKDEARKRKRERRKAQLKKQRSTVEAKLRRDLQNESNSAFSPKNRNRTLERLYEWLMCKQRIPGLLNHWNTDLLADAFGIDVANRSREALKSYWRTTPPTLWSRRSHEEKDRIHWHEFLGLLAVAEESSSPDWSTSLSTENARTAVGYATLELNGFPRFVVDLATSRPKETESVIGNEVSAELAVGGNYRHLPTLQALTHANDVIKRLCFPRLMSEMQSWPSDVDGVSGPRWADHLDRVLRVLSEVATADDREKIARECVDRYRSDPKGPQALTWLRGAFRFDAIQGANALIDQLNKDDSHANGEYAIGAFATLLNFDGTLMFESDDSEAFAGVLGKLIRLAYTLVREDDDIFHETVYSPGPRDHAQDARRRLHDMLIASPGSESFRVQMALANDELFASRSDRLRMYARRRAAEDAEFDPFRPEDVVALETRHEAPPNDRDGLFRVMMDRLDDLQHDFTDGDFTDRGTFQSITEEAEMQKALAVRLRDRANGTYSVTREEEVFDGKRTDIRLLSKSGDQKAVIEVKIADKRWSLPSFQISLKRQLVDKYLRDPNCKAGCLLLTGHDKKKYWIHPETNKRIGFSDMIAFMETQAQKIEDQKQGEVRIAVFGLDLTGP